MVSLDALIPCRIMIFLAVRGCLESWNTTAFARRCKGFVNLGASGMWDKQYGIRGSAVLQRFHKGFVVSGASIECMGNPYKFKAITVPARLHKGFVIPKASRM